MVHIMKSKNKVTIVFSRDEDDRGEPIAVFDDKTLLDEFLTRPLASTKGYDLWEKQVNPSYSTGNLPVWFLSINPDRKKPHRVIRSIDFDVEIDAQEGDATKLDGYLCLGVFAKTKQQATEKGMEKMAELKANGEWDKM